MKYLLSLLLLSGTALAAPPTCQELVDSVEAAFDIASEVTMTTEIMQGEREFAYSEVLLFKDDAGEWQSEIVEQRGRQQPDDEGDGEEPDFAFSCEGGAVSEVDEGWLLELPEQDSEIPVNAWALTFTERLGNTVPVEIAGDFEAKILLVPFKGTFSTRFTDWDVPVNVDIRPGD